MSEKSSTMKFQNCRYNPALFQLFDEILVNAADNIHRTAKPSMSYIKVDVDAVQNSISIENDGAGIPVELHPTEKVYIPEMIFGHLLTSSNFDDTEVCCLPLQCCPHQLMHIRRHRIFRLSLVTCHFTCVTFHFSPPCV